MDEEKFDTLRMYGLSVEYPRSWILMISKKQISFSEGRINLIGDDILTGLLWEARKHHTLDLQGYKRKVTENLEKKEKQFRLLKTVTTEVHDHPAYLETMETAGRAGFIGLQKKPVHHTHCIFFCPVSDRFITLYVSLLPKLKPEYEYIVNRLFSTLTCIH